MKAKRLHSRDFVPFHILQFVHAEKTKRAGVKSKQPAKKDTRPLLHIHHAVNHNRQGDVDQYNPILAVNPNQYKQVRVEHIYEPTNGIHRVQTSSGDVWDCKKIPGGYVTVH